MANDHDQLGLSIGLRGDNAQRPRDEVPARLPVALRTVFHVWVSRGNFGPTWSKRMLMAKWLINGRAEMGVSGRWLPMQPGQVAIYMPSIRHQFRALTEESEFCWFTMDGPLAEQFVLTLRLEPGVYTYGTPPVGMIHEMMQSLRDPSRRGRQNSSLMAMRAWYDIASSIVSPTTPNEVHKAQHIIEQELANVDLSAGSIAQRLNCHRGSLNRMFNKHTGMTVMDYITEVRLQEAKALLQHTDDKVAEVARKCGFRETTYFCRWLRKQTGMTPGQHRKMSVAME